MTVLDVDYVRGCFPAFDQALAAGTAFFDNAGGSYVVRNVLDRYLAFYVESKVQPYGASDICRLAGERMDLGRAVMADLLAVDAETLTFGPSTTQNINTLAAAASGLVVPGSAVVVTAQDHEANIGAWERLCRRNGAELRTWMVDEDGELRLERLEPLLDGRVGILCMTHSSNVVGTVNPVEDVIRLARPLGIRVVVDGVSFAPHSWPDIPLLAPDAYCFSTYKTHATHLGIMYVAPGFAETLDPQCHYFNAGNPRMRFDAAGPDHASIAALAGLGDYFSASHRHHFRHDRGTLHARTRAVSALMRAHETALCGRFLDCISGLPLNILGRPHMQGREANIALHCDRFRSADLSAMLARSGIAAAHGHFYARRLLQSVGMADPDDGVLRVSFAHYNTTGEVDQLVAAFAGLF